jgi:hypothetical protein
MPRTVRKIIRASNLTNRVWENAGSKRFAEPATGYLWEVPAKFINKRGTPITYLLTGEGKRKLVQRVDGPDWQKRLIAVLTLKEAKVDLGYSKAVVFIGDRQFQPVYGDWCNTGMSPREIKTLFGMDTPQQGRKDRIMAAKKAKSEKTQDASEMTPRKLEAQILSEGDAKKLAQTSGKRMCAFVIATNKKGKDKDLRAEALEFCPVSATAKSDEKWAEMKRSVKAGEFPWLTNVNVHKKGSEKPTVKGIDVEPMEKAEKADKKSKKGKKDKEEKPVKKGKKDKSGKVAKKVVKKVLKKVSDD